MLAKHDYSLVEYVFMFDCPFFFFFSGFERVCRLLPMAYVVVMLARYYTPLLDLACCLAVYR